MDEKQKDYSGWKTKKNKETQSKFTSEFLMMKTHDLHFLFHILKDFSDFKDYRKAYEFKQWVKIPFKEGKN